MKRVPALVAVSLMLGSGAAAACGTRAPEEQARIDAAQHAALRALAADAGREADMVLVGKVTALSRPGGQADGVGSVAFAVSDTLKGAPVDSIDARWKEKFVYSCEPAEQFHNVGFRQGGSFIVYIRDGEVFRAAAADELRSGLLSLEDERGIVASGG